MNPVYLCLSIGLLFFINHVASFIYAIYWFAIGVFTWNEFLDVLLLIMVFPVLIFTYTYDFLSKNKLTKFKRISERLNLASSLFYGVFPLFICLFFDIGLYCLSSNIFTNNQSKYYFLFYDVFAATNLGKIMSDLYSFTGKISRNYR